MRGLYPQHVIDEIRDRADIVDIVSNYVPLKKAGISYKALCPFHSEKTPSFNVSPAKQICHCFGCGKGGNVFTFIMEIEKVAFPEAVEIVAEKVGYTIPRDAKREAGDGVPQKKRLFQINDFVAGLFHERLLSEDGRDAREYVRSRGITDESVENFRLGLAPDSWDWLISSSTRPDSIQLMERLGLILPRKEGDGYYDRFRSRLIFPITDGQGRVVGFGGRALDDGEPKYLNSPDSPLFSKTNNLYGLDTAKVEASKTGAMMIMEGYTDVIMARQAGFANAVATLGTALTERHVQILKRFVERVIMVFDSDEAGRKASQRGIDLVLRGELEVRVAQMPSGMDPCDFIRSKGREEFAALIDQSGDLFDYKIGLARSRGEMDTVEGQSAVIDDVLSSVANFTLRDKPKQELLLKKLSREFGISEGAIRDRFGRVAARDARAVPGSKTGYTQRNAPREMGEWVIELMLASPKHAELVSETGVINIVEAPLRPIVEAILSALDEGGGVLELAEVFSRLEDERLCGVLSRIAAEMPDDLDCEKVYADIAAHLRKNQVAEEIEKQTEQLVRGGERTEEQEAEYLRKVADLKRQLKPNSLNGRA